MKITGIVDEIIFQNPDNYYTVVDLDVAGTLVTAVGTFPPISSGEEVTLIGDYSVNNKYGEQFVATEVTTSLPESAEGMMRYLASGLFAGIGPVTAQHIVELFRSETFDVLENHPERLAKVKGLSRKKAEQISENYKSLRGMQNTVMFLAKYDISTTLAIKIYKVYGADSEKVVSENPYCLISDVDGIGFLTADRIAMSIGIPRDSSFRIKAGIVHVFKENAAKSGHTYLLIEDLKVQTAEILRLGEDFESLFFSALEELIMSQQVVELEDGFALSYYDNLEKVAASRLVKLYQQYEPLHLDIDSDIHDYEIANGITLHDAQKEAVKEGVNSGVVIITGGPGTGKTTIIKCIIHVLKHKGLQICLCAPTGRAAKRMSEATGEEAKTIHRLLDLDFKNGKGHFTFNDDTRLPQDVVIVDEISMADIYVFNALVRAIKTGAKFIIVGDKDQLPSVGAGNVLRDLIDSQMFPVRFLTQIYRQSEQSLIVTNAHRINNGEMPVLNSNDKDFFFMEREDQQSMLQTVNDLVKTRLPSYAKVEASEIQVLAPVKKGVCGVNNLNATLQQSLNPPKPLLKEYKLGEFTFRQGDKVMQTVNNYNLEWKRIGFDDEVGMGVFNGDIGYVAEVTGDGRLIVDFEDGRRAVYVKDDIADLMLAYAVSVHKSQGSEFDVVVLAVLPGSPSIMTRNLLYTAVTRAKKLVVIVGTEKNVYAMTKNNYTAKRYTQLCRYIKSENEKYISMFN